MNNKWPKRWMKIKGFMNYVMSVITLRYSSMNSRRLSGQLSFIRPQRLHVGCGDVLIDGWLNILFEHRQFYGRLTKKGSAWFLNYNLLKTWPLNDHSVQFVAGSHFIEHIDLNQGLTFAQEAFRVLESGGVIRLSCPDLETYARRYIDRDEHFFSHPKIREWCAFKFAQTPGEIFAAKAYDSGGAHKWFYDFDSLKHVLESAGFKNCQRVSRLEGSTPDLSLLEPPDRELETVYIEAVKP